MRKTLIPVVTHGGCADALDRAMEHMRRSRLDTGLCRFLPGGQAEWTVALRGRDVPALGVAVVAAGLLLTRAGQRAYEMLCAWAAGSTDHALAWLLAEVEVAVRVTQLSQELPVFHAGDGLALAA